MILHADFETRSTVDLKKSTVDIYARHPTTDAWCMSWAFDMEPVKLWKEGEPLPNRIQEHIKNGNTLVAFNVYFEWNIWNKVMVKKHGWPELKIEQCECVQAMAYAMALPGSLDNALKACNSPFEKDMQGHRNMLRMSQPRRNKDKSIKYREDGSIDWWNDGDRKQRLYDYCIPDTEGERWLYHQLKPLSSQERELWLLDHKINERGIPVDTATIRIMGNTSDRIKARYDIQMQDLTCGLVAGCTKVAQLKKYINALDCGVQVESLAVDAIIDLLKRDDVPDDVKILLRLRQKAGLTSTAKLATMLRCTSKDERTRYSIQYHGATTGRFAGRGIQPHNFPRPKFSTEAILAGIPHVANIDYLEIFYGKPLEFVSSAVRSMICAGEGKTLIAGDFSAIESRKLAWLAGQENKLDIFRGDGKVYEHNAAIIYNKKIEDVTSAERQIGKVAELALGYQGAIGAFVSMAKNYNIDVGAAFEQLWDTASEAIKKQAMKEYKFWRQNNPTAEITTQAAIAATIIKIGWRRAAPETVDYWAKLNEAAINAVDNPLTKFAAGRITFKFQGKHLWCQLSSGRVICYPFAQVKRSGKKKSLSYMTMNLTIFKWMRITTYGGMLAENVTQASSRCLLTDAMHRIEDAGYPIVFHVHDEIISEIPKGFGSLDDFINILAMCPDWAKGLPLAADGWIGERFRK